LEHQLLHPHRLIPASPKTEIRHIGRRLFPAADFWWIFI